MALANNTSQQFKNLTDGNPDGTSFGQSANDRISLFGNTPVSQRTNPVQCCVPGYALGSLIAFSANSGSVANANLVTTNEVEIVAPGLLTTDFILNVNKPAAQAGMGIAGMRCANSSANFSVTFCNPTGANVQPTQNGTLYGVAVRGMNVISANLSANVVAANSSAEQIFTITAANAAGTAVVSSAGTISSVTMTNTGNAYYVPPTVVFTPTAYPGAASGANTATLNGYGASGVAIIDGTGKVTGIQMTSGGSGYISGYVTVSFIGGIALSPGMVLAVNKTSAANAGLGIGNVRVVGNNQIGITYLNANGASVTPVANDTYLIWAVNSMPSISPMIVCGANLATANAAAANNSNATAVPCVGITANDVFVSTNAPNLTSNAVFAGGSTGANTFSMSYYAGLGGATPVGGAYNYNIMRSLAPAAIQVSQIVASPTVIGANTTAEVVITLPANVTLPYANCPVVVNRIDAPQANLTLVGCRAASTTTLGLTFLNSSAANITPTANSVYLIAAINAPVPTLSTSGANVSQANCIVPIGVTVSSMLNTLNEIQQSLVNTGAIKGA